ncbi:MAG: hypothetical protein JSR37_04805 [Verrucomicrobia bacterium]|nr:hypothetical protein [Verrucomicrobiota bacterium]MBS0636248.1 hypothetical protein [Verrucomicrobiota bacterium]
MGPLLFLNYQHPVYPEQIKSIGVQPNTLCQAANRPLGELIESHKKSGRPCVVARVKDLQGKVHLFDGCTADALGSFKEKGYFKVGVSGEHKPCASIQFFRLVVCSETAYSFTLEKRVTYYLEHANQFWSQKRGCKRDAYAAKKWFEKALGEDPNNLRVLKILGEINKTGCSIPPDAEKARGYFARVLELDPEDTFALSSIDGLEEQVEEQIEEQAEEQVQEEVQEVVQQLEAVHLDPEPEASSVWSCTLL